MGAMNRGGSRGRDERAHDPGRGRLAGGELDTLITVLDLVRSGAASTRQEIEAQALLGRAVVTDRVGGVAWALSAIRRRSGVPIETLPGRKAETD